MALSTSSILSSPSQRSSVSSFNVGPSVSHIYGSYFIGAPLRGYHPEKRRANKTKLKISAAAVATTATEEINEYVSASNGLIMLGLGPPYVFLNKELVWHDPCTLASTGFTRRYSLPTWAEFDLGTAPVFWKTTNGLPPLSGEKLTLFYNPAANKISENEEFGIAFNGGFNQPIMCGGEPRVMLRKIRGKADPPIYTIRIFVPKHAVNLIFSFTNGVEWDGPYRLQFQVPKRWRNKPIDFFNEGLAEELSKEGACERAIYPDSNTIITRCSMIGNLSVEGGDRCNLDLVPGCTDPSSSLFNPLANVDDGSCEIDLDSDE